MLKKLLLLIIVLVLAGIAYVRFGHLPEPLPAGSQTARWLQAGPEATSYFDVNLRDDTRPTQANGDFAGSDARQLKTRIWHPQRLQTPRPLVIYSHGFMSTRRGGSYLAEHLASHGYIVAAMDYPLTHFGAPGGPLVKDVVNQPEDIRFLLDQFLSWNTERGHQFYNAVDEARIAVMGLSLGGLTSTLAAFHPTMGDPRIDAAVSIAGPHYMFAPRFFAHRQLPYLVIASPQDAMIDYDSNAGRLLQDTEDAVVLRIDSASHTGFSDLSRYLRWLDNPDWLGCSQLQERLGEAANEQWWTALGSETQRVLTREPSALCSSDELPPAMNPVRQQWLTTVAVYAFLESQFALGLDQRSEARRFLRQGLVSEMKEVSIAPR